MTDLIAQTAADHVLYSGRTNDINDELCLVEAFSDWGEKGWMVCVEVRCPGRPVFRTPKVWFADRADAVNSMNNEKFYGFGPAPQPVNIAQHGVTDAVSMLRELLEADPTGSQTMRIVCLMRTLEDKLHERDLHDERRYLRDAPR